MKGTLLTLTLLLLFCVNSSAQNRFQGRTKILWGPSLFYQNQQANFFKLAIFGLTDIGDHKYIVGQAGADFVFRNGKTIVIP